MRVLQISPSHGQYCGIAVFAQALARELRKNGVDVLTRRRLRQDYFGPHIVLLQHHVELLDDEAVLELCAQVRCPVVLFAHSAGVDALRRTVHGIITMCPGMVAGTDDRLLVIPHPARVPARLRNRRLLRARQGLPHDTRVIGTCGFLRFERQFVEILSVLLPQAAEARWFVSLTVSPWYIDSPGLLEQLEGLQTAYPTCFRLSYEHLDEEELNLRLQACDLLWCWTRTPSSPYASGVVSQQYASGTRIFAADKLQHGHILSLPNVVRGPANLEGFTAHLLTEIREGPKSRHDPAPISWDRFVPQITDFLADCQNSAL